MALIGSATGTPKGVLCAILLCAILSEAFCGAGIREKTLRDQNHRCTWTLSVGGLQDYLGVNG